MRTLITVTYLEMAEPGEMTDEQFEKHHTLTLAEAPSAAFCRFLYASVGAPWKWYMRRDWTAAQWKRHIGRESLRIWVAYLRGTPCGYFELEHHADNSTEIALFGLLPEFIGQGLGKALLQDALQTAWCSNPTRVWLHTCSLDHPQALPNYLARGMHICRKEQIWDELPDAPLQPW